LSSKFDPKFQPLSADLVIHKTWQVFPEEVQFEDIWFYSDTVIKSFKKFTLYSVI